MGSETTGLHFGRSLGQASPFPSSSRSLFSLPGCPHSVKAWGKSPSSSCFIFPASPPTHSLCAPPFSETFLFMSSFDRPTSFSFSLPSHLYYEPAFFFFFTLSSASTVCGRCPLFSKAICYGIISPLNLAPGLSSRGRLIAGFVPGRAAIRVPPWLRPEIWRPRELPAK